MTSSMKCLALDHEMYHKTFQVYLEKSTEHETVHRFIRESLPGILARAGKGKSTFDVISLGSGTGEVDLEILSQLSKVLPDVKVGCDIVEPSEPMLEKCKDVVSRTPKLENVNFTWNQMTASEFEKHWRDRQPEKKVDFIHMIQMLYYVVDPVGTILSFRSLLNENGKLLIILISGECGWGKLWGTYGNEFTCSDMNQSLTAANIKNYLTAEGINFERFTLPTKLDITDCFIPGNTNGELLLDLLTELVDFSNTAPPELKANVLDYLRLPDCTTEVNGRVLFNTSLEAFVLSQ